MSENQRTERRRIFLVGLLVAAGLLFFFLWPRSSTEPGPVAPALPDAGQPAPAPAPVKDAPKLSAPADAGALGLVPAVEDDALAPKGLIEGRVLSFGSGRGVGGAEVTFSRVGVAASTRCDAEGRFSFVPPEAGLYLLAAAAAPGHLPFAPEWGHSPIAITTQPGRCVTGITVYLTPRIEYLGLVRSADGKPVAKARVRVLGGGEEQRLWPLGQDYVSDAQGEFRFHAPDEAVLEATHPSFGRARARLDFSAQVSHRLELRFPPAAQPTASQASLRGQVVDANGRAVEGAQVSARRLVSSPASEEARRTFPAFATSDADGRFTLEELDVGPQALRATHPEHAPATATADTSAKAPVVLRLGPGGRLAGRVLDAATRAPVVAFTVNAWERPDALHLNAVGGQAFVHGEGRFELGGLPVGKVRVTASAPGYAETFELEVEVPAPPAQAQVELLLHRGARLLGRVLERGSRTPLAGARVTVEGKVRRGEGSSAMPTLLTTLTDGAGQFTLAGLADGPLSLFIAAAGHHARVTSTSVAEGQAPPFVEVELTPTEKDEEPRIELAGIGVVLAAKGEAFEIGRVLDGGGAARAGLLPGDLLLAVDGQPVAKLGYEGTIQAIRGPEGTTVVLTVRRGEEQPRELAVTRMLVRG